MDALYTLNSGKAQTVQYGVLLHGLYSQRVQNTFKKKLTVTLNDKTYKCESIQFDKGSMKLQSELGGTSPLFEIPEGESISCIFNTGHSLREDFATNKSMHVDYSTWVLEYHLFPAGY